MTSSALLALLALCARAAEAPPPTLLSPPDGAVLPASSEIAVVAWEAVPGATAYLLRVEDEFRPEVRHWANDCDAHYVCRTVPGAPVEVPVVAGHRYLLWVHAIGANGAPGSPARRTLRVAESSVLVPIMKLPRVAMMQDKIASETAAVRGLVESFGPLWSEYGDLRAILRLRERRAWLRKRAQARSELLFSLRKECVKVKEEESLWMARTLINDPNFTKEKEMVAEGMRSWMAFSKMTQMIDAAMHPINGAFKDDEELWERSRRQAVEEAAAAAGAVLLLVVGLALAAIWREARRTDRRILEAAQALARRYVQALSWRPDAPPSSGDVLAGNFRLLRELAADAAAAAFEARDLTAGRPVILRRLLAPPVVGEQAVALLEHARRTARFLHPRVESVQAAFLERGALYWAAPAASGRRLADMLGPGPLPMAEIKSVLSQLADVLDAARGEGLVHGCLGPGSILLEEGGELRLSGLGFAAFAQKSWTAEELAYRAPETAELPPGTASDVFSLGVLFYRLAVGRLPFPGPDVRLQQLQQAYVPPTGAAARLPREADYLVRTALQPDPRHRFATASEMFEILVNFRG